MRKVGKYLNIAKSAVIKTPDGIEEKILKKLESLDKDDKLLLDEKFLEYLKKNNSRIYLFNEKLKNNQGVIITIGFVFLGIMGFLLFKFIFSKDRR